MSSHDVRDVINGIISDVITRHKWHHHMAQMTSSRDVRDVIMKVWQTDISVLYIKSTITVTIITIITITITIIILTNIIIITIIIL